jgi:ADP-ribosylglycohydrolase
MRIGPVAMAYAGEELPRAARISALVTHGHPNALDAAEAGARILRAMLEGRALDAALVRHVARPGLTGDAVRAALEVGFDERRIPPGDGGWRSSSALGLAVAAALEARDFASAVERAARIRGDSDSVAAIAGMLLGAAGLPLPDAWLARLPERDRIAQAARSLAARGSGSSPA